MERFLLAVLHTMSFFSIHLPFHLQERRTQVPSLLSLVCLLFCLSLPPLFLCKHSHFIQALSPSINWLFWLPFLISVYFNNNPAADSMLMSLIFIIMSSLSSLQHPNCYGSFLLLTFLGGLGMVYSCRQIWAHWERKAVCPVLIAAAFRQAEPLS